MRRSVKISVIVPIYNVGPYVGMCIKSLINQTMRDIEIICVDDCSNDNSMDVVAEFASCDARIKIVRHDKNMGVATARNTGLKHCRAKYIMWCDPDDWYNQNMCQKMYDAIEKSGADFATCGTRVVYDANPELKSSDDYYYRVKFSGQKSATREVKNNIDVCLWNKIWRRDIIEKYNLRFPDGLQYEDAYFMWCYALWTQKIYFVRAKLYNYRRRIGAIMNNTYSGKSVAGLDHLRIVLAYYEYLIRWGFRNSAAEYEFWGDKLIPYASMAFQFVQDKNATRPMRRCLAKFVADSYRVGTHDFGIECIMRQMKNSTFMGRVRRFCGLYYIKESQHKRQIRICGVPVFTTRYSYSCVRRYLFGVRIW